MDACRDSHPKKANPGPKDIFKIYLKNPNPISNTTDRTRWWVAVLAIQTPPKADQGINAPTQPDPTVSRFSATMIDEPSFRMAVESEPTESVVDALTKLLEITANFLSEEGSDKAPAWGNNVTMYGGGRFNRNLLGGVPPGSSMF